MGQVRPAFFNADLYKKGEYNVSIRQIKNGIIKPVILLGQARHNKMVVLSLYVSQSECVKNDCFWHIYISKSQSFLYLFV